MRNQNVNGRQSLKSLFAQHARLIRVVKPCALGESLSDSAQWLACAQHQPLRLQCLPDLGSLRPLCRGE